MELPLDFGIGFVDSILADSGVGWNKRDAGVGDGESEAAQRAAKGQEK